MIILNCPIQVLIYNLKIFRKRNADDFAPFEITISVLALGAACDLQLSQKFLIQKQVTQNLLKLIGT